MTTALILIQAAYREGNLIPAGKQPTDDEITEALPRLDIFIRGTYGYEMGENLQDWLFPGKQRTAPVRAQYPQFNQPEATIATWQPQYPPVNSRIIFGSVTGTVYFPEAPLDGARMALVQGSGAGDNGTPGAQITLDGNGRTIEGADTYVGTAPLAASREWLYRADKGDWTVVSPITDGATECPFPDVLDDLWITMLSMRLAPRYGKSTATETAALAKNMMAKFKARYRQAAVTTYGGEQMPNAYESFNTFGSWFR